jgi:hypothetical protein
LVPNGIVKDGFGHPKFPSCRLKELDGLGFLGTELVARIAAGQSKRVSYPWKTDAPKYLGSHQLPLGRAPVGGGN